MVANPKNPDKTKRPIATYLSELEQVARERNIERFSAKSYEWFRKQFQSMGGDRARSIILKDSKKKKRMRAFPRVGNMYTFIYDAKHKDELPYWDAFPLILLVGPAEGGFYGVNLHYLPPKARAILFDRLLEYSSDKRFDSKTKLKLSYQLLSATKNLSLFKNCYKHYLYSQLGTELALIPSTEWNSAIFLPSANFQKAPNTKVWSDSVLASKR